MPDWVVSMHGGGCDADFQPQPGSPGVPLTEGLQLPLIRVPDGMRVYFYTSEGAVLSDELGWGLFHLLMASPEEIAFARLLAVEVHEEGSWVYDYSLSGSDDWHDEQGSASGVFEAGNRFGPQSWVLSAEQGFKLSWLFTQCAPGDSLHWLACRALSWPAWFAVRVHGMFPLPRGEKGTA